MDLVTFWLRLEELIPVKVLPKTMGSWFFLFFLPWFSFSFLFFCRIFYWICVGRARLELILNLVPCCLLAIVLQSLFDCLWSEFFSTSSQGWVSHEIPFEVSALHIFNGVILAVKKLKVSKLNWWHFCMRVVNISFIRDHLFCPFAKYSEKLTFLTPWYSYVCVSGSKKC